ncbi:hypothetical protein SAMN05216404_11933 [Nitrosospira multiformis]|uniref:Lipoprotein n=1 Tax=Nitrosospira multiformis TaxID=1231 RepID=A0A1H8P6K1_9PROT|nr:hypothetical protein [Nitrosospira multiformis]SEO37560.1 hypothetical protein SAMN05216404_11933 [Nitrosospira multiformis]
MKYHITVILCVLLYACAAQQQMILSKPGGDPVQRHKDLTECEFEAAKATASASSAVMYDVREAVVHDAMIRERKEQLISMCMLARGYTYEPLQ